MSSPVQKVQTKNLKAFLDANKKQSRLIGSVERHILTRPLDTSRSQEVLHPSEIIKGDWCHLEQYHRIVNARNGILPPPDRPALRLQSIFDEGHAIHHKWQTYFQEMGVLYGKWTDNGKTTFGMPPSPKAKYREVNLRSEAHLMSGHTDGWIIGVGDDCLIEIKSVGTGTIRTFDTSLLMEYDDNLEKAFNAIRRPFIDHRRQIQVYLHLAHLMQAKGELDIPAPDEAVVIYECKANQAYKEFTIGYDPDQVADVFDAALDIAWALQNNRPPSCNINPQRGCKKCAPYREDTK
jgi:hypothetical protein